MRLGWYFYWAVLVALAWIGAHCLFDVTIAKW